MIGSRERKLDNGNKFLMIIYLDHASGTVDPRLLLLLQLVLHYHAVM